MRILAILILLSGLLSGCAAERAPLAKNPYRVPMPKRMPYASDPRSRAEFFRGYRMGYAAGTSGMMVFRHYKLGYQPNAEQRGFYTGNVDGFLAQLKEDVDRRNATVARTK